MRNISEFLVKFKNLQSNDGLIEKEAKIIIDKIFETKFLDYKIDFKRNYLTIKTFNPALKSEFFIKKDKITKEIKKKFGKNQNIEVFFK